MMNAGVSYATRQHVVPIHPTLSELIPTTLGTASVQVTSPEELRDRLHTLAAANERLSFFIPRSPIPITRTALIIETANKSRLPTMVQHTKVAILRHACALGLSASSENGGMRVTGRAAPSVG
jgi:hypothetical protein